MMVASWWVVLIGLVSVVAVSPLLAGWSEALAAGTVQRWWLPRATTGGRTWTVGALACVLTAGSVAARPYPAWVILAAVGAVLIVVDVRVHLLPGRLVYPAAAVITAVLAEIALFDGTGQELLRAVTAAAAVGVFWLIVVFLAPAAMGLGDVRVLALAAGLLGWTSWTAVLYGQCLTFLLAALIAVGLAVFTPQRRGRRMPVPMGPAIIVATVIASWW